ncbi:PH domain-containing protein [Streptomyces nondiastaticus]|uniref:PH domain-containing protein n=1 Tax=Streptomyces nondiastaticus TaxID=3154512 RepID=UPI003420E91C
MTAGTADLLRPPANLPDRRAVAYWTVRALSAWVVLSVAQAALLLFDVDSRPGLHRIALVCTVAAGALHTAVMPRWRYRVHRWESAPAALYTQTGWLVEERRIAPVSRIQTVDSERGPLERLFGLTNITVTTASAAGPLVIQGVDQETARRMVAELTEQVRHTKGDAT